MSVSDLPRSEKGAALPLPVSQGGGPVPNRDMPLQLAKIIGSAPVGVRLTTNFELDQRPLRRTGAKVAFGAAVAKLSTCFFKEDVNGTNSSRFWRQGIPTKSKIQLTIPLVLKRGKRSFFLPEQLFCDRSVCWVLTASKSRFFL